MGFNFVILIACHRWARSCRRSWRDGGLIWRNGVSDLLLCCGWKFGPQLNLQYCDCSGRDSWASLYSCNLPSFHWYTTLGRSTHVHLTSTSATCDDNGWHGHYQEQMKQVWLYLQTGTEFILVAWTHLHIHWDDVDNSVSNACSYTYKCFGSC